VDFFGKLQLLKREMTQQRVPIVWVQTDGEIQMGELTSVDLADESAWVSMLPNHISISGRRKIWLQEQGYYELTAKNNINIERIKEKAAAIWQGKTELIALIAQLEKPINLDYCKEVK